MKKARKPSALRSSRPAVRPTTKFGRMSTPSRRRSSTSDRRPPWAAGTRGCRRPARRRARARLRRPYRIALAGQVARRRQAGRSGADDGHLRPRGRLVLGPAPARSPAGSKPAANRSRWPMATAVPEARLRLQTASHCVSWGQTRPQTEGSEFVALSVRAAAANSPASTCLTKVGMSMPTGQPSMHPGMPQSRQRRASLRAASASRPRLTSPKSRLRTRRLPLRHGLAGNPHPVLGDSSRGAGACATPGRTRLSSGPDRTDRAVFSGRAWRSP